MHKTHARGVYACMAQLFDGPGHAAVVYSYVYGTHSQSNLVAHACGGLKTYICHCVNSLRSSFHKNIRYKWMNILTLSLFQHVHKPYLVAVWNLHSKIIKSFQVI